MSKKQVQTGSLCTLCLPVRGLSCVTMRATTSPSALPGNNHSDLIKLVSSCPSSKQRLPVPSISSCQAGGPQHLPRPLAGCLLPWTCVWTHPPLPPGFLPSRRPFGHSLVSGAALASPPPGTHFSLTLTVLSPFPLLQASALLSSYQLPFPAHPTEHSKSPPPPLPCPSSSGSTCLHSITCYLPQSTFL